MPCLVEYFAARWRVVSADVGPGRASAVWSVAQLMEASIGALNAQVGAVTVTGELGAVTRAPSGHCYFVLKDADARGVAVVRCVMFRRALQLSGVDMAQGLAVEVRGRLSIYEPRGELQLVVESIRHAGAGALYEEFLRRKARLASQGLFDTARKRPIASWPRAIGLVTSLSGAVLHDFCVTMARRAPHVSVIVYPAPVQGAGAASLLIAALQAAGACQAVDVIALCRGGGSVEDLWPFNDEGLVRAVVDSPVPVICGVGHETDVTLCDWAADMRAPTPTAAAELACAPLVDGLATLGGLYQRLTTRLQARLDQYAQQLDRAAIRLARPSASLVRRRQVMARQALTLEWAAHQHLDRQRERVVKLGVRLDQILTGGVGAQQGRVELLSVRLAAMDPRAVLSRGYVLVTHHDGRPAVAASDVAPCELLRLEWADGVAHARVDVERSGAR